MSIPTGPKITKVAEGVYDITGNRGSKNEGLEKKKAEFKPYATGLVKSQISESNKNRPVRPSQQVPILNLNKLPNNDSDLTKLEGSHYIAELEARESLAGNQILFNESKIINTEIKNFFNKQEFDDLYSEDDEVTKKALEDLNNTLKKDNTNKT